MVGDVVTVNGVPTYYEIHGDEASEPVVLLHGGLVGTDSWGGQVSALSASYRLFVPERRGHGHTPDIEGPITFDLMTADTVAFVREVVGGPVHLVGWSDGGILALLTALAEPGLVRSMVVIGANFHYLGGVFPADESGLAPDSPAMAYPRDRYAATSPDGIEHWPVVFAKVVHMWATEPTLSVEDLARIDRPTLVMVGDDDVVKLSHTVELYEALPRGQLAVVPGASHMLPAEKPDLVNALILEFLAAGGAEPHTMMPIRRSRHGGPA
jgi:pimeloyl-ACP methyl ester carboxylesterase